MEISGKLYALSALPPGKETPVSIVSETGRTLVPAWNLGKQKGIFQLRALKQDYSAVQHISHYSNDNASAPNGGDDDEDDDDDIVDSMSNNNNNAKLYYLYCALSGSACA